MYKIKMVCSVCRKVMGFKDGGKSPNLISHGICEDCLEGELAKIRGFKIERGKVNGE